MGLVVGRERERRKQGGAQGMWADWGRGLHRHTRPLFNALCCLFLIPQLVSVFKIREIPQNPDLIVTHTDSKIVYLWNMASE